MFCKRKLNFQILMPAISSSNRTIKVFVSTLHNYGGRHKIVVDAIWRNWEIALMNLAKVDLPRKLLCSEACNKEEQNLAIIGFPNQSWTSLLFFAARFIFFPEWKTALCPCLSPMLRAIVMKFYKATVALFGFISKPTVNNSRVLNNDFIKCFFSEGFWTGR